MDIRRLQLQKSHTLDNFACVIIINNRRQRNKSVHFIIE